MRRVGLAKLGRLAIDGLKIKANASKRKAMSSGRMKEKKAAPISDREREVAELKQAANDAGPLKLLLAQVEANRGSLPTKVSADAGYGNEANIGVAAAAGVDAYLAGEKIKHGQVPPAPRGRSPKNLSPKERMRRKLRSKRGPTTYAKRKAVVEPLFGQIKEVRELRRLLLSGFDNVRAEWQLSRLTHNLLKLFRSGAFAPGVAYVWWGATVSTTSSASLKPPTKRPRKTLRNFTARKHSIPFSSTFCEPLLRPTPSSRRTTRSAPARVSLTCRRA